MMPWVTDPAHPGDCGLCPASLERHRITRFADGAQWVALCPSSYQQVSDVVDQRLLALIAHGQPR